MNNKPVAWMRKSDKAVCSNEEKLWFIEEEGSNWNYVIPLYTHPVNPKYDPETGEPLIDGYPLFSGLPHPVKELTEILATIKCIADDISGYKDYENTYSDGWLDACNTVYDEVFAILRKAQEK